MNNVTGLADWGRDSLEGHVTRTTFTSAVALEPHDCANPNSTVTFADDLHSGSKGEGEPWVWLVKFLGRITQEPAERISTGIGWRMRLGLEINPFTLGVVWQTGYRLLVWMNIICCFLPISVCTVSPTWNNNNHMGASNLHVKTGKLLEH